MIHHRNMLIVAFIAILEVSCTDREPIDILAGYDVALTSDNPLRYYYHRMPENDTSWTDYRMIYEGQNKFVIEEQFADGLLSSKCKYKITAHTLEVVERTYYFVADSLTGEMEAVSADILQHLKKEPESEYSGFSFVDYYETSMGVGVKLQTECTFRGKEIYHYNGRDIESIKLDHKFKTITYLKWFPLYFHETVVDGYVIFSKDVGMTYYRAEDPDRKVYSQKLLKVEELI